MHAAGLRQLVFSSSATVYGTSQFLPYTESHPTQSTNPYGNTTRQIEILLRDLSCSGPGWHFGLLAGALHSPSTVATRHRRRDHCAELLQMTALCDCTLRAGGPVLLFENPTGHARRVMFGIWSFLRQFMYTQVHRGGGRGHQQSRLEGCDLGHHHPRGPTRDTLLVDSTPNQ